MREVIDMLGVEEQKLKSELNKLLQTYKDTPTEDRVTKHSYRRQIDWRKGEIDGIKAAKQIVRNVRQFVDGDY